MEKRRGLPPHEVQFGLIGSMRTLRVKEIISNYGENEVEYGNGTLVLKTFETVVFKLH